MDKHEAAEICRTHPKDSRVTLADGRTGSVVDSDAERGCLWVLPVGDGEHDERVWASQIMRSNAKVSESANP